MKSKILIMLASLLGVAVFSGCASEAPNKEACNIQASAKKGNLVSSGENAFFILKPGYRLEYKGGDKTALVITVLDETKLVDSVVTRVVEEIETKDGKPSEVSRNYLAIDKNTKDIYCFGEDSSTYESGKLKSSEGSWLSGVNSAKYGLLMPNKLKVGDSFCQGSAPKVTLEIAQVIAVDETIKTYAGVFKNCLRLKVSNKEEDWMVEMWYAPGIGLIKNDEFELSKQNALPK